MMDNSLLLPVVALVLAIVFLIISDRYPAFEWLGCAFPFLVLVGIVSAAVPLQELAFEVIS